MTAVAMFFGFMLIYLIVYLSRHPWVYFKDMFHADAARTIYSLLHSLIIGVVILLSMTVSAYVLLFLLTYLIPYFSARYIFEPIDKIDRFLHERKK